MLVLMRVARHHLLGRLVQLGIGLGSRVVEIEVEVRSLAGYGYGYGCMGLERNPTPWLAGWLAGCGTPTAVLD